MKDTVNNETAGQITRGQSSTTRQTTSLFASNLRFLLQRNGMTAKELAGKINLSEQTISGWMNGKKNPRPGTISEVASFFGVQFVDLFDPNGNAGLLADSTTTVEIPIRNVGVSSKTSYAVTPNGTKPSFAILVNDDSMLPIIQKGDVVLYAELKEQPKNGTIVAVSIGNRTTVRRIYYSGSTAMLVAINSSFQPITYQNDMEDCQILGKALSLQRNIEDA